MKLRSFQTWTVSEFLLSSPIWHDLRHEWPCLKGLMAKALLLILFLAVSDRSIGWVLRQGLDRYYGLDVPAQVLCVGHSQTVLGVDKTGLEKLLGVPVAKFAVEGANTPDRFVMIQYYLERQPTSVRAIVYGVDAHSFTSSGLSSSSYRLLFPFIDDELVRNYIRRNCASRSEFLLRRLLFLPRYNDLTLSLAVRGFLRDWANYKLGKVDVDVLRQQIETGRFRRIAFDKENIQAFEEMVDFVMNRHLNLLLAYIPTIDILALQVVVWVDFETKSDLQALFTGK
jgi:hypothetical protein